MLVLQSQKKKVFQEEKNEDCVKCHREVKRDEEWELAMEFIHAEHTEDLDKKSFHDMEGEEG